MCHFMAKVYFTGTVSIHSTKPAISSESIMIIIVLIYIHISRITLNKQALGHLIILQVLKYAFITRSSELYLKVQLFSCLGS